MNGRLPAPRTWLLLRGLAREAGHWGEFPALLQARCPVDRVIALDLPGNGERCAEPSPLRIAVMTEACRAELAARGVAGPVLLLAMSMGAMVALDWADRHPGELQGVLLVNTSLAAFSGPLQRLRPRALLGLLAALLWQGSWQRETTVFRLTSAAARPAPGLIEHWCALAAAHPVRRLNVLRQLLAAARFSGPRQAPAVPLLIAGGGRDRLVAPACSRAIAAAWQLPLALHPQAGHDLALDAGDWLASQAARWAERLPAPEPIQEL